MRATTSTWASLCLALLPTSTVLAQGLRQATGGSSPTTTASPTSTSPASTCTASLISTLCDYKDPGEFAVASSGRSHCWEYCNSHPPCNFVVFVAGNPYTGTGTCWLYPGETFDASAGTTGCDYLSVYDKPSCGDEDPTATQDACAAATETPSAVASVCGYPTPDDGCFSSCTASSGAPDCLSQCADADSCAYVVFKAGGGSPYLSGTCWMYPNGTYDSTLAKTCEGEPEQYVYENKCPKKSASASASASASSTAKATGTATGTAVSETGAAETGATAENAKQGKQTGSEGAAAVGRELSISLAVGMVLMVWLGLQ